VRGPNSRRRVFDHQAFHRIDAQRFRTLQIRLGMRLSVGNIVRGDHDLGCWDTRELEACSCEVARSRSDHAPAAFWNRANQVDRARHYADSVVVSRLAFFQAAYLGLRIKMRSNRPNNFDGTDAVSDGDHLLFVNAALARPDAPLAAHGTGGINKNSVEIEEDGGAAEGGHSFFYHRARQSAREGPLQMMGTRLEVLRRTALN